MLMLARELVRGGRCRNVLVVAGENRLTGQSRDSAIQTLAQVGDPDYEVVNGASIPPITRCSRRATCTSPGSPRPTSRNSRC